MARPLTLSECYAGMRVCLDEGFTCHSAGIVTLQADEGGALFFPCASGRHYIVGQCDNEKGILVGIFPITTPIIHMRNLSVLSYAQIEGYTAWHYKCPHPIESIYTPGYFKDACDMMQVGDTVMISCGASGGALIYITRIAEPEVDFKIMART